MNFQLLQLVCAMWILLPTTSFNFVHEAAASKSNANRCWHLNANAGFSYANANELSKSLGEDDNCSKEHECDNLTTELQSSQGMIMKSRRQFFYQQILASTAVFPATTNAVSSSADNADSIERYFSLRNNNNLPYAQRDQLARQKQAQQQQIADKQRKAMAITGSKKWTPFTNVNRWNTVETCLLEILPVKNAVFRRLQDMIENLEVPASTDADGWSQSVLDALTALSFLESKRSSLESVFNQDDSTALFISKSSMGERNIEVLRSKLEDLVVIASGGIDVKKSIERLRENKDDLNKVIASAVINPQAFIEGKRQALLSLAELGELLVPSFPYSVPTRGKFGYLPRLLGRCTVTFTFERPSSPSSAFGLPIANEKRLLGNVTIVADGYLAPITAGNFVDLSLRNFYTGLSVKALRKRLGVVPSWSDNIIVNDLTELKDNLDVLADDFGSDLSNAERKLAMGGFFRTKKSLERVGDFSNLEEYDDTRMKMDVVMPILGSFQEGFYDPLTAKLRRIPLEILTLDSSSPTKATLTYSSSFASLEVDVTSAGSAKYSEITSSSSPQRSFSSSISTVSSNSTATSSSSRLNPVISFNIPNVVALNHPDRVSNGGSSEFFSLPLRDISTKRTKLLDGQYAPFGYIVRGSDIYQSLRPGDVIRATYVSELGPLNLVKIRKNAFEGEEEKSEDDSL